MFFLHFSYALGVLLLGAQLVLFVDVPPPNRDNRQHYLGISHDQEYLQGYIPARDVPNRLTNDQLSNLAWVAGFELKAWWEGNNYPSKWKQTANSSCLAR
jgi:hypothetical protein